jgi:para-nitrobenzyl esterase
MAEDLLAALRLDEAEDLVTVPVRQILEAQGAVASGDIGSRNLPGGRAWGAVLDGDVLPRHPQQAVADGAAAAHVPLLVGANRDEVRLHQLIAGEAFRPADEAALLAEIRRADVAEPEKLLDAYRRRIADPDDLAALRGVFLTDAVFRMPAVRMARAQVAAGGRAHQYLMLDEPCGSEMGACHGVDLLHVFDKLALVGADTPEHRPVRETLTRAWARFAATGDPGWPVYDPEAAGNSRAIAGPCFGTERMVTEPPADDVTALYPALN